MHVVHRYMQRFSPSQPGPNHRDLTIHLIPALSLPTSTFASTSNNTKCTSKPEGRTRSRNTIHHPPHLALPLGPGSAIRKSKQAIKRRLLPTFFASRSNPPSHPSRPSTHKMPHTRSHKEEVERIPKHRTPSNAMRNIRQPHAGTTALNR